MFRWTAIVGIYEQDVEVLLIFFVASDSLIYSKNYQFYLFSKHSKISKNMGNFNFKAIAKGTMTALSLIVSVINIADFSASMYRKYRKPQPISGFAGNNETSKEA